MRLLTPFVLIVAALTAVIWMDDTPPDADLVFVNQNDVFTLDPQRMSYLQDLRLAHALYEGLVRWDNFDFSILPAVASKVPEPSADGLRYTFVLRREARWSNGAPVTAHDFVYSWKRAILPDTAADYSNMFFAIDGAEEFFEWRVAQTRGFVSNPWTTDGDVDPDDVLAVAQRLECLLDADDVPPEIPMPGAGERESIAAELERMRDAIGKLPAALSHALRYAPKSSAWLTRLENAEPRVRAAESEWMWRRAEKRFDETVKLVALDSHTLEVTLRRPTAYFKDLLCFGVFFPVYRPTVEGWPADLPIPPGGWHDMEPPPFEDRAWVSINPETGRFEQKHNWTKPDRHVGNGPYRLAQWRYKRDLRLEKNERFHVAERVLCDSILALTIEDTNTAVLAFESGRVDWLADVSTDYQSDMLAQAEAYTTRHAARLAELLAEDHTRDQALSLLPEPESGERRNIHKFPTFGTDFYSFNCRPLTDGDRPNPFADPAVRRAFVRSVNKQTIVDSVTRLKEPVTTTLIPPGSIDGYTSPKGLSYDPDEARAELAAAGWKNRNEDGLLVDADGESFPVIDLLYSTNIPRYKWISLELKSQWERELGVRVELRGLETKFYKEDLKQGKFMIARGRWYGDYGDPTTFLDLCRTNDGNNDRKYSNPDVDRWLDEAAQEADPEKRMRLLEKCEAHLMDVDVPILVLCQLVQVYMYEPGRVTGLSDHARLTQFLDQMQVSEP